MKPIVRFPAIDRRILLSSLAMLPVLSVSLRSTSAVAQAQRDPLPSWNEGATKSSILEFVARVTTQGGPSSSRSISASRPSTMTARSGSSSRCMCNWPLHSTV